jgi:MoxR-like ATPase
MNNKTFVKLQTFRSWLNVANLEREEIVDGLLASLISRQNAFLLGEPGTGKSDLVRSICKGISGANYFGYLLTPTTDPSEVFGPVAVTKLLQDEYSRDVDGYLPSAHIGFLDEMFRGSSAILNSLLMLLNERTFNNGKEYIQTPIESIVAATNSWPEEESLQAFADRFLFRPTVLPLKKPSSKRILDQWALGIEKRPTIGEYLTLEELKELQESAENIKISDEFLDKFGSVWDMLQQRSITISDRRRVQILKFLKAWAVVQGDSELYPEHMHNSITHIVYRTEEDKLTIKETLDQEIPTADNILATAKRAAAGILSEYTATAHRFKSKGLQDLNEYVIFLRRCHKDIDTIKTKVSEVLDDDKKRMGAKTRTDGVKLIQSLETHSATFAKAINEFSK